MIFSSFGYQVQLYDVSADCLTKAMETIGQQFKELCQNNNARGTLTYDERMALISTTQSLDECIKGTIHIQECVPDSLPLKQDLFKEVDGLLGDNQEVAICSSTSVHLPSLVFSQMINHSEQCLVVHPINPPLHVKLVEIIPAPKTREEILIRTRLMLDDLGQKPVVLRKEVYGFALNRFQAAVLQVAFRLIHDGVMTPEDVDTVVSDGLGPRYAFMGGWMTTHLNATGMAEYMQKYIGNFHKILKDCEPIMPFEGEAAQQVVDAMNHAVPVDKLEAKRAWRDRCLVELNKIKDKMGVI